MLCPDVGAGDKKEQELEFRIIDYGHARLDKYKQLAKLPHAPGLELSYRKSAHLALASLSQHYHQSRLQQFLLNSSDIHPRLG